MLRIVYRTDKRGNIIKDSAERRKNHSAEPPMPLHDRILKGNYALECEQKHHSLFSKSFTKRVWEQEKQFQENRK